jgi:FkbM family methyltransferase
MISLSGHTVRSYLESATGQSISAFGHKMLRHFKPVLPANRFLDECRGVIHVGANSGQERKLYNKFGLNVVWIEPIPSVYAELQSNISRYPRQKAIQALVTDSDGKTIVLNVASNGGASSSILELRDHKEIWPDVTYVSKVECVSKTLATVVGEANIDMKRYDALIMDTQGSELLVLRGGEPLLDGFKYIKTEAADFEMYAGCVQLAELEAYLGARGFVAVRKDRFKETPQGDGCYDVLFQRR